MQYKLFNGYLKIIGLVNIYNLDDLIRVDMVK